MRPDVAHGNRDAVEQPTCRRVVGTQSRRGVDHRPARRMAVASLVPRSPADGMGEYAPTAVMGYSGTFVRGA